MDKYSKYQSGGIAKQVKVPQIVHFKTMEEIDKAEDHSAFFDQNLIYADFTKIDHLKILHYINLVALN